MAENQPWIEKDDYLLLSSKAADKSVPVIAKELRCTEESIINRTAILRCKQKVE